jgi:hypothetical protein
MNADAPAVEQTTTLSARSNTFQTVHILEPKSVLGVTILFPSGDGKLTDYSAVQLLAFAAASCTMLHRTPLISAID